jgi:hypothetical protein
MRTEFDFRIGDLWLDQQNDLSIITGIDEIPHEGTVTIEVISGNRPGAVYHERKESFGANKTTGEVMFFHTLMSRSLND